MRAKLACGRSSSSGGTGLLLSVHHTQLQPPGGQKERAVWGRPGPNPASPLLYLLKQAPCLLP